MSTRTACQSDSVPRWVAATAVVGTILIAMGAFWLSFTALADLARLSGIDASRAWVWPLIVDGVIVVATVSVVALHQYGSRATWYPWMLLASGALVSVVANALHATLAATASVPVALAAMVAAVPPLVLLAITHLTVELTRRSGPPRQLPEESAAEGGKVRAQATPQRGAPASPRRGRHQRVNHDLRDQARRLRIEQGWSNRQIATHLGVHRSTVGRWFRADHDRDNDEANVAAGRHTELAKTTSVPIHAAQDEGRENTNAA
jgi:hypothetical protein